ncbi:MAG: response regulator [Pleurocapsa minor GSE-CHR-MK-17-07R]|jgi:CheY-like chemotaxis protein|nr:response regulator [Pleurocapsa minor GSE-CHR-MK 17-07R]
MPVVLVVDDEEGFRHILQIVLQRAGFGTLVASNAAEALQIIERHPPDLVLLDDMMPGMSGSDLCVKLKGDPQFAAIPVLMHSANSKLHNPAYVESIRADGVLLKPCPPRDVVAAVSQYLQTNAS